MLKARIVVLYYSSYGTNYELATVAAESATAAGGDVRLRKVAETVAAEIVGTQPPWKAHMEATIHVPEVEPDDMAWAQGIIFSFPTRFGNAPTQLRAFLESLGPLWQKGQLADKVVTAMTSAGNPHGGQESTILNFYTSMMHWGAIIVPPGYGTQAIFQAGGNPYGLSVVAGRLPISTDEREAVEYQARRVVTIAERVHAGSIGEAAA